MQIELIEVARIVEDPDQPRKHHDEESLHGLADSIRQHGLLQPITVIPLSNVNMYRIVTGERRWRAAQMAGLDVIPCVVKELDTEGILTEQLIENMQREDLQPLEKAQAIAQVKRALGATNRELASRLGMSERAVGYLLDLLELPKEIGSAVVASPNRPADGQLTEKHARFLKQLNDRPNLQTALVEKIREEKITSDQTSQYVKALRRHPDKAEEILSSPTDHLLHFFRDEPPVTTVVMEEPGGSSHLSSHAQRILDFLAALDTIRPANLSRPEVRQIEDALTSLRVTIDGLLHECKLVLGEKA
ncbi:MAG TPA: ParB/RepB/Spo0J family partition protein [Chthonomonadales bacterium]|nr:ParB/RepB/Spo0J family partition protein [Chthonomonadales bacterium]